MKNPISKLLSKPIIWYLRIKNIKHINVIVNIDGVHLEKRDFKKEKEISERHKRIKDIFTKQN